MLSAGFEDIGLQLLVLLVGGALYAISKVAEKLGAVRRRTRERMDREQSRKQLEWAPGERPEPAPSPEAAPPAPPRPPRRPPRARPIRARAAAPAPPAPRVVAQQEKTAGLRLGPRALRDAMVYRELLGPPRALRPFHASRLKRW